MPILVLKRAWIELTRKPSRIAVLWKSEGQRMKMTVGVRFRLSCSRQTFRAWAKDQERDSHAEGMDFVREVLHARWKSRLV